MVIQNWFAFAIALQYLAAAGYEMWVGRWTMAGLWICYGVAMGILATVKG